MIINCIRSLSRPLAPLPTKEKPTLRQIAGVSAILFDVYGTLFVSASGDIEAMSSSDDKSAFTRALKAGKFSGNISKAAEIGPGLFQDAICRVHKEKIHRGITYPEVDILAIWNEVLLELSHNGLLEQDWQGCTNGEDRVKVCAVSYECLINPVWPMPSLSETLAKLLGFGFVLGIVSNAQFYTSYLFPALLGLTIDDLGFEKELCTWSYKIGEGKPSLRLYALTLERLKKFNKIRPEETVFVGNDMLKDIWPAQCAGCRTILFAGDERSLRMRKGDERCISVEPDAVITDLSQLTFLLSL